MKIKRIDGFRIKKIHLKGEGHMVVELQKYRNESPDIEISLVDMLFDKNKRKCIYKQYDDIYSSTEEEEEIYEEMMGRGIKQFDDEEY